MIKTMRYHAPTKTLDALGEVGLALSSTICRRRACIIDVRTEIEEDVCGWDRWEQH